MSEQPPQPTEQNLNISDSVLKSVQIAGNAGRDMKLTQIHGRFENINVFGLVKVEQAPTSAAKSISQQEYRRRGVLLDKVKNFWINGVLENSLYTQVLVDLGLEERREFVQNQLSEVEEFPSDPPQVFPAGTTAADIFEGIGAGRTLLILGEPGSGKTVTLLKLAESLIARTENDLSQPLPVVVNLSSWAKQRKPIANWLVQEIYDIYGASKPLGKIWVEQEQLILLLDGLDEVDAKYRNDCVKALNQFIQTHGLTEVVVCSRIRDYENLSERLKLCSAIYVQPLTSQQIDQFLEQAGESLCALKEVLKHNAELQAFASSPLILSIMSLVYQGYSLHNIIQGETIQEYRQLLFDTYITRMFQGGRISSYTTKIKESAQKYPREKAQDWLIWLAQEMVQAPQTIFLIEQLQPRCLPSQLQTVLYRIVNAVLIFLALGLMFGIFYGTIEAQNKNFGLIINLTFSLIMALVGGLYFGIIGSIIGLFFGLIDGIILELLLKIPSTIETVEILKWSWRSAKKDFYKGWIVGLVGGSISYLVVLPFMNISNNPEILLVSDEMDVITKFLCGLVAGMCFGLYFGLSLLPIFIVIIKRQILTIENLHWSWKTIKLGLILGLFLGLTLALIWGFGNKLIANQTSILYVVIGAWFLFGVFFGIISGLISTLIGGFKRADIPQSNFPNQGIWKSAKNSLIFGVIFGLFIGLIVGLTGIESHSIFTGLLVGIWIFAPIGAVIVGGSACFQHLALRLMLYRKKYIPWNYARFLDYAADRLFMQKVGGGYIFVHRMLLEHFAQMELKHERH